MRAYQGLRGKEMSSYGLMRIKLVCGGGKFWEINTVIVTFAEHCESNLFHWTLHLKVNKWNILCYANFVVVVH